MTRSALSARSAAFAIATFCVFACSADRSELPGREPPNVLFVLTDDLRWDALGAYGNDVVKTPNLDVLARQGARLDALYTASPVCNPSRASFLSGLYPHQEGITTGRFRMTLGADVPTVASYLNEAGYVTGFIGKAHLGTLPRRWKFQKTPVVLPGRNFGENELEQRIVIRGRKQKVAGHPTEKLADEAIRFIETHRDDTWFLWLATSAPHSPYVMDEAFPYEGEQITPPPGWSNPAAFGPHLFWPAYYSLISRVDHEIGRVLDALTELGLERDTLVFVTSDHGVQHGSHNLVAKGVWYDESTRLPGIVRWPGRVAAGSQIDALISSVDLLPTLLDLVSLESPDNLEGKSFLPALTEGPNDRARRHVFSEASSGSFNLDEGWAMVGDGRYKLVAFDDGAKERLYDLAEDPGELVDLIDTPAHVEVSARLRVRLAQWRASTK